MYKSSTGNDLGVAVVGEGGEQAGLPAKMMTDYEKNYEKLWEMQYYRKGEGGEQAGLPAKMMTDYEKNYEKL